MQKFCAWCNRRIDMFSNKAIGQRNNPKDLIPKPEQIGTHGICSDCQAEELENIKKLLQAESFREFFIKNRKNFCL